jgi:hypothetical protein
MYPCHVCGRLVAGLDYHSWCEAAASAVRDGRAVWVADKARLSGRKHANGKPLRWGFWEMNNVVCEVKEVGVKMRPQHLAWKEASPWQENAIRAYEDCRCV